MKLTGMLRATCEVNIKSNENRARKAVAAYAIFKDKKNPYAIEIERLIKIRYKIDKLWRNELEHIEKLEVK
jgi:hypothetical protein